MMNVAGILNNPVLLMSAEQAAAQNHSCAGATESSGLSCAGATESSRFSCAGATESSRLSCAGATAFCPKQIKQSRCEVLMTEITDPESEI
jgi:hypothetical protein